MDNFARISGLLPVGRQVCPAKNMETSKLWSIVLAETEILVSKPIFATFFKNVALLSLENNVATVACPNQMILKMVESRYYSLIKNIIDKHTQNNNSLIFLVKSSSKEKAETGPLFEEQKNKEENSGRREGLNPFYTFANFAVSSSNQVAYAASQAVYKNPGSAYNPLFLYGGVGVGKTHLMQAVAHALFFKKNNFKVIYATSEEFTNEIVDAIRNKNTKNFRTRFRNVDLLLMDDIQFIAGKDVVQEEFFHTFNSLQKEGAQIIFTSDKPPSKIAGLEERLRSRFDGGLTVDISEPDFELRAAILLIKAKSLGFELPMEVAQLVAASISDTRSLEGFLRRLLAESSGKKTPISLDLAKSLLDKKGEKEKKLTRVAPEKILQAVADRFGLKTPLLKGPKRNKPLAFPRQIIMYLLKTDCGYPYMEIGRVLGGRDHTTIMYGVEKVSSLLSTDQKLAEDISWIKKEVWG